MQLLFFKQGLGKSFLCGRRINFSHAYSKNKGKGHPLSAQQPLNARNGPLDPLDEVISGIQLEHRVDTFALVKSLNLLCIFLNCFQNRIAGLGLFVPQREIDAVRPAFQLVGKTYSLKPGNHKEPDMHPTRENTSVW